MVLLVLFELRIENSATCVPRSMTEENLRDLINLLHNPTSERQHFEEIAECVVCNYANWCLGSDSTAH